MASSLFKNILCAGRQPQLAEKFYRTVVTTAISKDDKRERGWFERLLVREIEPTKESHSSQLSDKEVIYELQTHNVRPGTSEEYLKNYEQYVKEVNEHKEIRGELCGSWSVGVGDQDQCVHLWKFDGGFQSIDEGKKVIDGDKALSGLIKDRAQYLRSRHNQYVLAFSFWPKCDAREGPNIYELRSYFLKPGTMIEWGHNWEKAIQFRQSHHEAWGGYFSQVGRLYNVHHIWCYKDLVDRKREREAAWTHPGWDEVVSYTVPLISNMHTRILYPVPFSPAQ